MAGFPQFADGDVEIHFSEGEKYVLHSFVLALHSSWFKASLSERWNKDTTGGETLFGGGESDVKNQWVYELRFDKNNTSEGTFLKRSTTNDDAIFLSAADIKEDEVALNRRYHAFNAHRDLMNTIYHVSPKFSGPVFIATSIMQLTAVAAYYGCEAVAKLHIDNHLRNFRYTVLEICHSNSTSMLELAIEVKADWIFMEAATNLLGRSNRAWKNAYSKLVELGISEMMDKKRSQFVSTLREVELSVFRLSSPTSGNTSTWYPVALHYLRDCWTQLLAGNSGSGLQPGYANAYHTLARAGTLPFAWKSPVTRVKVEDFLLDVYGEESLEEWTADVMEKDLACVFADATKALKPILKDATRLRDKKPDEFRALRFMEVSHDELPWIED